MGCTPYTVKLSGGTSTPRITDPAGNALAADRTWSFTTGDPGPCDTAPNEVVAENCKPGSPASEWDITGAGDPSLQGFATDLSVDQGGKVDFKIDSAGAAAYGLDIYRLGYYGGSGARKVATVPTAEISATDQPECTSTAIPNQPGRLVDCANWSVSASWQVPADATSGIYLARPTRPSGSASHIVFVVRDDNGSSDVLFQTSDTTWQAYNPFGGYNTYNTGSTGTMSPKVSYNRPFTTRGGQLEDWLFNAEFPTLRWLERNGYDVSYTTHGDVGRRPAEVKEHKTFLSVGHDEYWSGEARDAVTAARDTGTHLAFLSGNEVYWKIRWEDSAADARADDQRTMVVYKEGSAAGAAEHYSCFNNYQCDPSDVWTGLWREAPGSAPENKLTGQISWRDSTAGITVPGEYAPLRFWRNTDIAGLAPSGTMALPNGLLGYEWNHWQPQYADHYPAGRVRLSTTTVGSDQHHLSLYRVPSGALVFGTGTVQWAWGLDAVHDRGSNIENRNVQQATLNLLADMGVQPVTRQSALSAASASTDTAAPVAVITSPANGGRVAPNTAVTVTGTATDSGGRVAAVEVSTDGGTTWRPATGRDAWSFNWTTPASGSVTLLARAVDDSANLQPAPASSTVTIGVAPPPATPGGLTAASTATGVALEWDDVADSTGYHVYRATSADGPFVRVNGPASAISAWTDTLAPAGTSVYRVTAVNSSGVESAPSTTVTAQVAKPNLLLNPSFEVDANNDTRPDSWTSQTRFTRSASAARSGAYGGRHQATNNANYTVGQTVRGITTGGQYAVAGSVRVPPTSDAFSVTFRVTWQDNNNRTVRTDPIATVNAATNGWTPVTGTVTAPAGATRVAVQMVVSSLNATVEVEDFALR